MKRIGMVVAVEITAVMKKYAERMTKESVKGFPVYSIDFGDKILYITRSGAGEIRAAACTQMLIDLFKVELIINFGVVGALNKEFSTAETCVVDRVVHYDMDTSAADNCEVGRYLEYEDIYLRTTPDYVAAALSLDSSLKAATCASGDKFIADEGKKHEMSIRFDSDICDMESAAVVLVCDMNSVPNLLIKTVSDSIKGGVEEFRACVEKAADVCLAVVDRIINEKC